MSLKERGSIYPAAISASALAGGFVTIIVVFWIYYCLQRNNRLDEEQHEGHSDFISSPIVRRPVPDIYPTITTLTSERQSTDYWTGRTHRTSEETGSGPYEMEQLSLTMRAAALYSPRPSETATYRSSVVRRDGGAGMLGSLTSLDQIPEQTVELSRGTLTGPHQDQVSSYCYHEVISANLYVRKVVRQSGNFSQRPFQPDDGVEPPRTQERPGVVITSFHQRRWSPSGTSDRPRSPMRPRSPRVEGLGLIQSPRIDVSSIRSRSHSPPRGRQTNRAVSPLSIPRTPSPSGDRSTQVAEAFPFAVAGQREGLNGHRRLSRSLFEFSLQRPASTIRAGSPAHGRLRRRQHSPFPTIFHQFSPDRTDSRLDDEIMQQVNRLQAPFQIGHISSGTINIRNPSRQPAEPRRASTPHDGVQEFNNMPDTQHMPPLHRHGRRSISRSISPVSPPSPLRVPRQRDISLDISEDLRPTSSMISNSSPSVSRSRPLITGDYTPLRTLQPVTESPTNVSQMGQSTGWETDSVPSHYPSIRAPLSEDLEASRATEEVHGPLERVFGGISRRFGR